MAHTIDLDPASIPFEISDLFDEGVLIGGADDSDGLPNDEILSYQYKSVEPFNYRRRDVYSHTLGLTPVVVELGRTTVNYAESHRGFAVAAVGVFEDREGGKIPKSNTNYDDEKYYKTEKPRIGVYAAANFKKDDNDPEDFEPTKTPKNCAENNVMTAASEDGFKRLIAMYVFGTINKKRIFDVTFNPNAYTLMPCGECVDMMWGGNIADSNSGIITVGSGARPMQVVSLDELSRDEFARRKRKPGLEFDKLSYSMHDWSDKQALYDIYAVELREGVQSERALLRKMLVHAARDDESALKAIVAEVVQARKKRKR